MGLLKHFRSKSRLSPTTAAAPPSSSSPKSPIHAVFSRHHITPAVPMPAPAYRGRDHTQRLPDAVLRRIFGYVCPHTQDTTYEASERSQIGDGCMLCDLRDLAASARVCRKWYQVGQRLLYGSVRIDAVHYCALEDVLAERRKKHAGKPFRGRGGSGAGYVEPGEIPNMRLSLLCRTVRENGRLAEQVRWLKLPYMTRETAKGELARTVSALPNLRYVDLPDAFFTGDASCLALRGELQARCPDIRKMAYRGGSEEAFDMLAQRHWLAIEILDLRALAIEPATLRIVLATLPALRDLTLADLPWVDDSIFQPSPGQLPDFPPVHTLRLENIPHLTAQGLVSYLQTPAHRDALVELSLSGTGISVPDLHLVLWHASALQHLAILETVSKSMALTTSAQLPPLNSLTLTTLNFEITSSDDVHGLQRPAESYYAYLASSLHQNALPALTALYVRDPSFPEMLLLPRVPKPFATASDSSHKSQPSNLSNFSKLSLADNGASTGPPRNTLMQGGATSFNQTLEVFSKGIDELEWVFTFVDPAAGAGSTSAPLVGSPAAPLTGRPLSAYDASRGLGPQWAQGGFGGEARKSIMVGNGFGGFLAVPQDEVPRPMTAGAGGMGPGGIVNLGMNGGGNQIDGVGGTKWGTSGSFMKAPPSFGGGSSLSGGGWVDRGEVRKSRLDMWR